MSYFLPQHSVSLFKTHSGFDTEKQFPGEDNLNSARKTPFPEGAMVFEWRIEWWKYPSDKISSSAFLHLYCKIL